MPGVLLLLTDVIIVYWSGDVTDLLLLLTDAIIVFRNSTVTPKMDEAFAMSVLPSCRVFKMHFIQHPRDANTELSAGKQCVNYLS